VLGLADNPVSLIGHDMGGAVAVGFAAKYPDLCLSLCLLAPVGIKYMEMESESWLKQKYFGEYVMYNSRNSLASKAENIFFDTSPECPYRELVDKYTSMINWQIDNTNGYLGAILSGIRLFPLRGMDELFTAVGRFDRPVLVLWGTDDGVASYSRSINIMERCFPKGYVVGVRDCGHHPLIEQFTDVMTEILSFHKICHEDANIAQKKRDVVVGDEETKL
jgi:pimeloyl-ACP methyl ester carboxylesterase